MLLNIGSAKLVGSWLF